MPNAEIIGLGHALPKKVVTNKDLEKIMDTSDEWIRERTGIETRRWISKGETCAGMALEASKMALADANLEASEIDCIIFATLASDHIFPGGGCVLGNELGLNGIPAFDIRNACSGFIYGLTMANSFIRSGQFKKILLIGAEAVTNILDKSTHGRNTAVIFADGAGAAIISATESNKGVLTTHIHADGKYAQPLSGISPYLPQTIDHDDSIPGHGVKINMEGQTVFKHAVTRFPQVINEALTAANKTVEDIDLLVPHQANLRITQAVGKRLGIADEKVVSNIQKYGNTTAASIPIAMSEAKQDGRLTEGKLVCLAAFGAGFTWGSALVQF